MASWLFSSIQSLSTKVLEAVRRTTLHLQDPAFPDAVDHQNEHVRKDLEKLGRMLARIQAVSKDAEEREIHDRSVRLWLEELKGVAYKAEDVLDEFNYEVLKSIVEGGAAAIEAYHRERKRGIKRKFAGSSSPAITNTSIPDAMAEGIKVIRERFEEISKDRVALQLREEDGTRVVTAGPHIQPPTSSHMDERAIFGREEEKEKIISLLHPSNGPNFMVLPIVGMGGLGKTTLAQLVYNDSRVRALFQKKAWVSVSEDFNLVRLTRAIIELIGDSPCGFSEFSKLQDILNEKIKGLSLFVVLDDVWNEEESSWEQFRVAFTGAKIVRILATTRNISAAEKMQTMSPFLLGGLPEEKCWSLFKHFAFENFEGSENGNLLVIGRSIVEKCKGLPLASKVLGGMLRYEMDERRWMEVLQSDISETDEKKKILPALQLSYEKLPLHLRPCFLYLSIFPKATPFEKSNVIRLWMAQGYINASARSKKTLEEIGSEYFHELQGRSLIDCWAVNKYCLHDLIHDLAKSISHGMDQPDLETSSYKVHHLHLTENDELSDFIDPCNYKAVRTFVKCCQRDCGIDPTIFSAIPCLRALELRYSMWPGCALRHLRYLCMVERDMESFPESICLLYNLQTLDMDCCNIRSLPENIINLINLRYFRLCSSKIEQLHESIGLLHNLNTLSLEDCTELKELPKSIDLLTNLRVLQLSKKVRCYLPRGTRKLTNIETLNGHFKVTGNDMIGELEELKDLNKLNGSLHISGLRNIGIVEYSKKVNLASKPNIRELILNFEQANPFYRNQELHIAINSSNTTESGNNENIHEAVLESLRPHGINLRKLEILDYEGRRLPSWLHNSLLPNLTNLTLKFHTEPNSLPLFGQLAHLRVLKISGNTGVNVGKQLSTYSLLAAASFKESEEASFPLLEELLLSDMLSLVEWQANDSDYACLKKLRIRNCPKLRKLATIPQEVKVLEIRSCGCQDIKISSQSKFETISISNCGDLKAVLYRGGRLPLARTISISNCPNLSMFSDIPEQQGQPEYETCGDLIPIDHTFVSFPVLQSISIRNCPKLRKLATIPQEVKVLEIRSCGCQDIKISSQSKFETISISNCGDLKAVLYRGGRLPLARTISISNCPNLSMFSDIPEQQGQPEYETCGDLIPIDHTFVSFPVLQSISIRNCPKLRKLATIPQEVKVLEIDSCGCQDIKISSQSKLETISISNCGDLKAVLYRGGKLPLAWTITISNCPNLSIFSDIPEQQGQPEYETCGDLIPIDHTFVSFPVLQSISIRNCPKLQKLATIPQEVKVLEIDSCGCQDIKISSQSKLETISISNCGDLKAVLYRGGKLPLARTISISNCPNLSMLSDVPEQQGQPEYKICGDLIPMDHTVVSFPVLQSISIRNCPKLQKLATIPQEVKVLEIVSCGCQDIKISSQSKLETIDISSCGDLKTVLYRGGNLPLARTILLSNCPKLLMFSAILKEPGPLEKMTYGDLIHTNNTFGSFPVLQSIFISNCPKIDMKVFNLQFPKAWMFGSNNCCETRLEERYNYEENILNIRDATHEEGLIFSDDMINIPDRLPIPIESACHLMVTKENSLVVMERYVGSNHDDRPMTRLACHHVMLNMSLLVKLEIQKCRTVKSLVGLDKLNNLRILCIYLCPELQNWKDPNLPLALSKLNLEYCCKMSSIPSLFSSKHEIFIVGCPKMRYWCSRNGVKYHEDLRRWWHYCSSRGHFVGSDELQVCCPLRGYTARDIQSYGSYQPEIILYTQNKPKFVKVPTGISGNDDSPSSSLRESL